MCQTYATTSEHHTLLCLFRPPRLSTMGLTVIPSQAQQPETHRTPPEAQSAAGTERHSCRWNAKRTGWNRGTENIKMRKRGDRCVEILHFSRTWDFWLVPGHIRPFHFFVPPGGPWRALSFGTPFICTVYPAVRRKQKS